MKENITREDIKKAIEKLRQDRERISRRNVIRVTGGSMSTVHRLMTELEALEELQVFAPKDGISETEPAPGI